MLWLRRHVSRLYMSVFHSLSRRAALVGYKNIKHPSLYPRNWISILNILFNPLENIWSDETTNILCLIAWHISMAMDDRYLDCCTAPSYGTSTHMWVCVCALLQGWCGGTLPVSGHYSTNTDCMISFQSNTITSSPHMYIGVQSWMKLLLSIELICKTVSWKVEIGKGALKLWLAYEWSLCDWCVIDVRSSGWQKIGYIQHSPDTQHWQLNWRERQRYSMLVR